MRERAVRRDEVLRRRREQEVADAARVDARERLDLRAEATGVVALREAATPIRIERGVDLEVAALERLAGLLLVAAQPLESLADLGARLVEHARRIARGHTGLGELLGLHARQRARQIAELTDLFGEPRTQPVQRTDLVQRELPVAPHLEL